MALVVVQGADVNANDFTRQFRLRHRKEKCFPEFRICPLFLLAGYMRMATSWYCVRHETSKSTTFKHR